MKDQEVETIKKELMDTLLEIGIDPVPYNIAIRITAETIREREKVYHDFLNDRASRVCLQSWNDQVRACLSMLRLTPGKITQTFFDGIP